MAQTKIWDIEGMFQAGHKCLETIWEHGRDSHCSRSTHKRVEGRVRMREGEISFCNERRTEVVSCFRQGGGDDEEGTDCMRWGKEGLALILSHSYFLIHLLGMLVGENISRSNGCVFAVTLQ